MGEPLDSCQVVWAYVKRILNLTLEFLYKILPCFVCFIRFSHVIFRMLGGKLPMRSWSPAMVLDHVHTSWYLQAKQLFEWLFQLDDEANLGKWLEITLIRGCLKGAQASPAIRFVGEWRWSWDCPIVIIWCPKNLKRPRWFRHFRGQIAILHSKKCSLTFLGSFCGS